VGIMGGLPVPDPKRRLESKYGCHNLHRSQKQMIVTFTRVRRIRLRREYTDLYACKIWQLCRLEEVRQENVHVHWELVYHPPHN
jgi:hypothetical protein